MSMHLHYSCSMQNGLMITLMPEGFVSDVHGQTEMIVRTVSRKQTFSSYSLARCYLVGLTNYFSPLHTSQIWKPLLHTEENAEVQARYDQK